MSFEIKSNTWTLFYTFTSVFSMVVSPSSTSLSSSSSWITVLSFLFAVCSRSMERM